MFSAKQVCQTIKSRFNFLSKGHEISSDNGTASSTYATFKFIKTNVLRVTSSGSAQGIRHA